MDLTPAMAERIELWPLDKLTPYARNARTHSEVQVGQLAASMVEFGVNNPILVDKDGGIVAGHGRLLAARKLGLPQLPVVVLDHLTPTQRRAYVIADNRLTDLGGWDAGILAEELADLSKEDLDMAALGFDDEELSKLIGGMGEPDAQDNGTEEEADDEEVVPEPSANPVTRPGDVWLLGGHRLICGDGTDPGVVDKAMAGDKAALLFTSPPYGNQRDYTTGGILDWGGLMRGVFTHLDVVMADAGQVLVNLGLIHRDCEWTSYWTDWVEWMRSRGWRRFGWYVWDQGPALPGDWSGRLGPSFEFVFHFNRESRRPNKIVPCSSAGETSHKFGRLDSDLRLKHGEVGKWTHEGRPTQGFRIPDSVIRVTRQRGRIEKEADLDHPAPFPVKLSEHIMLAYTNQGDVVFEPFCGSGSSLLAGQRTGRKVRAVDIAPEYVDVAVKRFQKHHPDLPAILEATSRSFEEVVKERLGTDHA
jgi:DNA modification methylase